MGLIVSSQSPVGTVGRGLFFVAISVFVFSVFDPSFGPVATGCIAAGGLAAALLVRRRPHTPHIDPRLVDTPDVLQTHRAPVAAAP